MKKSVILERLMDVLGESKPTDDTQRNKIYRDIYEEICEMLMESGNKYQRKLVFELDTIVGMRLGDFFYDGVVAGLELSNALRETISDPTSVYNQLLDDYIAQDQFKDQMYDFIRKHKNLKADE